MTTSDTPVIQPPRAPAVLDAAPSPHSRTDERADRVRVWLRISYVGVFILCAIVYAAALPARYDELRTLSVSGIAPPVRAVYQLHPREAGILADYQIAPEGYAAYMLALEMVQTLVFVGISIVLFGRAGGGVVAALGALTTLIMGVIAPATVTALRASPAADLVLLALDQLRLIVIVWFLLTFPDGVFVPRHARRIGVITSIGAALTPLFFGDPRSWTALGQSIGVIVWMAPLLWIVVWRYRHHFDAEQRLQTRWVMWGMALFIGVNIARGIVITLFPALNAPGEVRLLFHGVIAAPLLDTMAFILIPLSLAASILRYNLYGVTLVINRSLVYGGLTVGLAVVFLSGFFALQAALRGITHQDTLAALVIAAAVSAALFNPARVRLQRWIDTHIFRLRIDLNRLDRLERADRARSLARLETPITQSGRLTGRTLGAYTIGGVIGSGGMGEVYHGQHSALQRAVAVKVLGAALYERADLVARFEREARLVATLDHPHIVRVFDYGVDAGICYMVMEYIDGQPLNALLRAGALPIPTAHTILTDIAAALDCAHGLGIVHRDVKPGNVMIQRTTRGRAGTDAGDGGEMRAILMDFGIAKLRDDGFSTTLTGTGMIGTLDYAAPEQITSARAVDPRADIYALGVVAYQLVTGHLPFEGTAAHVVFAHLQQPPPDPRAHCPVLSAAAAAAILQALSKDPADRFPTAGAFVAAWGDARAM
jgi:hypothetical protein